ncbi:hypothetical protein [Acinetobacter radioresistens]|uniref:hypothetical protein n=1 Tax=Acinetobacter radioresistens TaxID=40216 RepID=UPI000E739292|nr:hypothetical protein [Acinetobacter radioresistens]MCX0339063.1 hypothetical protein [Acinetobacter radioresistens]RJL68891.1 hypothetical protein D5055_13915 [Acinetobacter radioresistens]
MNNKIYSNTALIRSLLLAPIPSLLVILIFSAAANGAGQLSSVVSILFVAVMIYAVYCILALPFAYGLSQLIQLKFHLNLGIILVGSISVWLIMLTLLQLILNHHISMGWELYLSGGYYMMALLTGFFYWLLLKYFDSQPAPAIAHFNKLKTY